MHQNKCLCGEPAGLNIDYRYG